MRTAVAAAAVIFSGCIGGDGKENDRCKLPERSCDPGMICVETDTLARCVRPDRLSIDGKPYLLIFPKTQP